MAAVEIGCGELLLLAPLPGLRGLLQVLLDRVGIRGGLPGQRVHALGNDVHFQVGPRHGGLDPGSGLLFLLLEVLLLGLRLRGGSGRRGWLLELGGLLGEGLLRGRLGNDCRLLCGLLGYGLGDRGRLGGGLGGGLLRGDGLGGGLFGHKPRYGLLRNKLLDKLLDDGLINRKLLRHKLLGGRRLRRGLLGGRLPAYLRSVGGLLDRLLVGRLLGHQVSISSGSGFWAACGCSGPAYTLSFVICLRARRLRGIIPFTAIRMISSGRRASISSKLRERRPPG